MTVIQELGRAIVWGLAALIVFIIGLISFGVWHDEWSGYNATTKVSDGVCNIAVIPVHGEIGPYSYIDEFGLEVAVSTLDDFEMALRAAERDPHIHGVIVSVDSPGGSPYAGEAMANALERSSLTSAAVIRDLGASAAYWLSTGSDRIFASSLSSVGSIGVTMSYLEKVRQNEDSGLDYIEISSAPYKDAGNPDRYLTDEERALFQTDIDVMHQEFVNAVSENRGLPVEEVQTLADGNTRLGKDALLLGLIDEIGDKESARAWLASELGWDTDDAVLCEW